MSYDVMYKICVFIGYGKIKETYKSNPMSITKDKIRTL